MVLHADSDAAYLVLPGAKSHIGGYFFLSSNPPSNQKETPKPMKNAPVHVKCAALKHVVASAVEAETGGLFRNGQEVVNMRCILAALDHPQPPTPLKTDNSTAVGFANGNIRQKLSKSWDMRYHWLRDRATQRQLRIYWDKAKLNELADYFTKHHAPQHHIYMRPKIMHMLNIMLDKIYISSKNKIRALAKVC